jgi:hypothetical protein
MSVSEQVLGVHSFHINKLQHNKSTRFPQCPSFSMYLMHRLTSFLHALKKKSFWFSDKPSMHQILHCYGHCSLLCPSLDSVPKFALVNARNYRHHFSCWRLRSGLFLTDDVGCFHSKLLSFTLLRRKTLFPYCAESLRLISAPGTPSAHKIRVTALCSFLMRTQREPPCW